jgi:hypothetical protein
MENQQIQAANIEAEQYKFEDCRDIQKSSWTKSGRMLLQKIYGAHKGKPFIATVVVAFNTPTSTEVEESWCEKQ